MNGISYSKRVVQVSSNLRVAEVTRVINNQTEKKEIPVKVNHVFCIDISGSMYGSLTNMRQQLKSRLVEIVSENDTVTLIWFNSSCGFISEMVQINSANDVREMNKMIDKYLVARGCTNFFDPIKLTNELIDRINQTEGLWNFIFLSDGGHNTGGTWDKVMEQIYNLQPKVSSATIIEYGYWADSQRLTEMAENLGGSKIFSEDFNSYEVDIENILQLKKTEPRVEFDIKDFKASMKYQVMFAIDDVTKTVNVYSTDRKSSILIPNNTTKLYFLEQMKGTKAASAISEPGLYAAIFVFADKMKYDVVESLLAATWDKDLIEMYCNSFGKQKLAVFKERALDRVFNYNNIELVSGYKPNSKKYCVLDLIDDLMSSDDNKIYPLDPDFEYTRTGAKSVVKKVLTEEMKNRLVSADTKLKVSKVLDEVEANSVRMEYKDKNLGYSVSNLTWNEERANLSLLLRIDVKLYLPKNEFNITEIDSFIYRNYTIIKDGILNFSKLPVSLTSKLRGKFKTMKLITEEKLKANGDQVFVLEFGNLPIINKKRTESVFSYQMSKLELDLLENKCFRKYLAYLKKQYPDMSKSTGSEYSPEVTQYLKSLGITSYNGYSPNTELDKSGDFYMANTLKTLIQNFSSLPKIEDVIKKSQDPTKTLTTSESYMKVCMDKIDSILKRKSSSIASEEINSLYNYHNGESRRLITEIAKSKFSIILSRKWFADKAGFDDNSVDVSINGQSLKLKWEFRDQKVDL